MASTANWARQPEAAGRCGNAAAIQGGTGGSDSAANIEGEEEKHDEAAERSWYAPPSHQTGHVVLDPFGTPNQVLSGQGIASEQLSRELVFWA
jgi:hypothetical protein